MANSGKVEQMNSQGAHPGQDFEEQADLIQLSLRHAIEAATYESPCYGRFGN
jgi:hypothetical protein